MAAALIRTFDRLVKLKFALFGLPITLSGALLALPTAPHFPPMRWLWILLCFLAARTAGMAFNELIDRKIDALNPRTSDRVLPSGEAKPHFAALIGLFSTALFIASASQINPAIFIASPFLAFLIWAYSYTKRFTSLCHFVLGAIHFAGPVCAYLAITGTLTLPAILLGAVAFLSVTATEIVYAISDHQFDKTHGLHSLPVRIGIGPTLLLSRLLHSIMVGLLALIGAVMGLPLFYFVGVLAVMLVTLAYHKGVSQGKIALLAPLGFRCNTQVSLLTLLTIGAAIAWRTLL